MIRIEYKEVDFLCDFVESSRKEEEESEKLSLERGGKGPKRGALGQEAGIHQGLG